MPQCSKEDRLPGRSSSVSALANLLPENTCETHFESASGRERDYFDQQAGTMPRVMKNAGIGDADALCGQMQAMRIMVDDATPHGEPIVRRKVVRNQRDPARPRIILPPFSSTTTPAAEQFTGTSLQRI